MFLSKLLHLYQELCLHFKARKKSSTVHLLKRADTKKCYIINKMK